MDENFKKFKKKVWTDILIKCVIAALLAAFVAVNATLLPCKLYGVHILWVFYVLIGLGGFAVGGGVAFLILRTTDKKIAQRMDAELNLSERVQTALVYENCKSDILDLQLENTNETLKPIPARALPFKNLVATLLCGVVAVAAMVAVPVVAFTVPPVLAAEDEGEQNKPEPPRHVSDWEWAALDELIKYVQNSKIADEESKTAMVSELTGLKNLLLIGVSQSSLSAFVGNTATQILNEVKTVNEKYPNDAEGNPHPQAEANSREAAYVATRLYEIFNLLPSDGSDTENGNNSNNEDEGEENPDDVETVAPPGGTDGGLPFFDAEEGYVSGEKFAEIRQEYYKSVQAALEEGLISKEEWENIIVTYFGNLNIKEED